GVPQKNVSVCCQQIDVGPGADRQGENSAQSADCSAAVEQDVVPGQPPCPASLGDKARNNRLLQGECRAAIGPHSIHHPHEDKGEENRIRRKKRKGNAACSCKQRQSDQCAAATNTDTCPGHPRGCRTCA